ncbi:hypothetical protein DRH14_05255, partial [Candidatus Shapirobacteria bacterium]
VMLDKKLKQLDKKRLRGYLEDVNHLQSLIENLWRLSKSGIRKKKVDKVKIKQILTRAERNVTGVANKKKIKIISKIKGKNEKLRIDSQVATEILTIFLDNAVKYSQKSAKVWMLAKKTKGRWLVEVKDRGSGISQKDLLYIFDRFYRADRSRSQREGFGLGLAVAKKLSQEVGWKIGVKSKLGQGSIFQLFFS